MIISKYDQNQNNNEIIESIVVQFIKDQCMQIGLIENLEETYHRYSKIILQQQKKNNNNNEEKIYNCANSYANIQKEAMQQKLVMKNNNDLMMIVPNSNEWNALEKLNKNDIYLYEKIKEIFIQQGSSSA